MLEPGGSDEEVTVHEDPDRPEPEVGVCRHEARSDRPSNSGHEPFAVRALTAMACLAIGLNGPCLASDPLPSTGDTMADDLQKRLSAGVAGTAAWLDSFFADDNFEAEANTTSLRLGLGTFSERGEGTDFRTRSRLRLSLPRLENRLRIVISGASDDFDTTDSDWEDVEQSVRGIDDDSLQAGLTYFFRQDGRRNVSLGGGLRFRSGKPGVYVRPRYRHVWNFTTWDLRFIQRLTWYSDAGLDSRTELQLERLLDSGWFFRTTGQLDWYEEEDGVFPQLKFLWRRPLSERRVLAIHWNSYFETQPSTVFDSTLFRVQYRQRVWREWLWFTVAPQVVFPREQDYEAVPGLMLEVEGWFQATP